MSFWIVAISGVLIGRAQAPATRMPDFNREVRPILAQHCFKCHGPDAGQRKAGLRLDSKRGATGALPSGNRAIVPGDPLKSVFWRRVASTGADCMPPAYANKPLSAPQKATLRRWIAAGAEYRPHWAFVAPQQTAPPRVRQTAWTRNPIDAFVLARLEKEGLHPAPEADRYTLARRLSLDLIGLPPTREEADAFVRDPTPDAYEKLVDRLLASPHYGERWARRWLDLARYADTNGYEKDRPRSIWPYRDWVINALNRDMPFDQFTIAQLAGDLLPNAGLEDRIATGFHRNTMLNEEGGIDPLEFRFYAMTDRVATTGTVWLGLTTGCAQCHTHKFDPITQREYYGMMAFLNNTEERTLDVPSDDAAAKRRAMEAQIAAKEAALADRFPAESGMRWTPVAPQSVTTASGAAAETLSDGSVRISGINPERDTYTVSLRSSLAEIAAVRLEALPDPSLGGGGPGRTPHGNFVLTGFSASISVTPSDTPAPTVTAHFTRAEADYAQEGFPAQNALRNSPGMGWAIQGPGSWNVARSAVFTLEHPIRLSAGSRWTFRLDHAYGGHHTLGRFRLSLGTAAADGQPREVRRRAHLERRFGEWLRAQEARAVQWEILKPTQAKSNLPLLTVLEDSSLFVSGDQTKRDVYDLDFSRIGPPITAVRLEALPDDRLPKHGPGRVFYEGPAGDFFLSEITLTAGGVKAPFASAAQSGGSAAQAAIDGDPQTGWTIQGRQGLATSAVFRLAQPLDARTFSVQLLFERYFAAGLGRFRIAVTSDLRPAEADLPADVEEILRLPAAQRPAAANERLMRAFLASAPELEPERQAIDALRKQLPEYTSTLVFSERPPENPRPTFVHRRGEFLQPEERVEPDVFAVLPPLPANAPRNRLSFARWLVAPQNPLAARVLVNRQWAAFFGKGIVRTLEDFGYQGELPTHPQLLDWLAVEFVRQGWSLKKLHRLIVTSAAYRQASRVTPLLQQKDPENRLLARGPRVRLEAELLRDSALMASGLLSPRIGGPSVFPPQPPGVTSEGTYGPLAWNVSPGEDRYRRGLYTFSKRTAPYAMFTTFDAPSGEVCLARRESSNTPLQALALLNDRVFVEAAQALGAQTAAHAGSDTERLTLLFRRCLTRPPTTGETEQLTRFCADQKARFERKELDPVAVAGEGAGDAAARAAWTAVARALLNLDEAIVKR